MLMMREKNWGKIKVWSANRIDFVCSEYKFSILNTFLVYNYLLGPEKKKRKKVTNLKSLWDHSNYTGLVSSYKNYLGSNM